MTILSMFDVGRAACAIRPFSERLRNHCVRRISVAAFPISDFSSVSILIFILTNSGSDSSFPLCIESNLSTLCCIRSTMKKGKRTKSRRKRLRARKNFCIFIFRRRSARSRTIDAGLTTFRVPLKSFRQQAKWQVVQTRSTNFFFPISCANAECVFGGGGGTGGEKIFTVPSRRQN